MTKTRMTNMDRQAIASAITAHKFDPLEKEAKDKRFELAEKVYDRVYSKADKEWMAAAPKGGLVMSSTFSIRVAGQWHQVEFKEAKPIFAAHSGYGRDDYYHFSAGDELGEAVVAAASRTLREERNDAYNRVVAALSAFRNFEDVLTGWPEAESFVKAQMQTKAVMVPGLPAIKIADLNAALGLPPETKKPIGTAKPKATKKP